MIWTALGFGLLKPSECQPAENPPVDDQLEKDVVTSLPLARLSLQLALVAPRRWSDAFVRSSLANWPSPAQG